MYDWLLNSHPIRLRRHQLQLSLPQFAEAVRIHFVSVSRIERGVSPKLKYIRPFARVLLVDETWLYLAISYYERLRNLLPNKEDCARFQELVFSDIEATGALVDDLEQRRPVIEAAMKEELLPKGNNDHLSSGT